MATALHIIERAFSKIGVLAAETPLTASEVQTGHDVLNDMLSLWDSTGFLKGVEPVDSVDDEINAPRFAELGIKASLALMISDEYGKAPTPAMVAAATVGQNGIVAASINIIPEYPSTLPLGSGNQNEDYFNDTDFFPCNPKKNF